MHKRKPGAGRPIVMSHPWGELAKALGGSLKLVEALGVSQSTLNRWERRECRIPAMAMKEVERLCHFYGIELKEFQK